MKLVTSSLLVGAATANALSPIQHVLQAPKQASEAWTKPLHNLQDSLKSLTGEARALWDEVSMMFPEAMDKTSFFSPPKKHSRRLDSYWDSITKGADVQSVWIETADGEKERDVDGKLEAYNLRSKRIDPSSLGVDPGVVQYSGYLDDNQNDKHLFYCLSMPSSIDLCNY
jgi:cathepsin A (carboxypeptidase C)